MSQFGNGSHPPLFWSLGKAGWDLRIHCCPSVRPSVRNGISRNPYISFFWYFAVRLGFGSAKKCSKRIFEKNSFFALFWPKTVKKWPFWPEIQYFGGFWLITSNFDISFGWKLPKTFSLVPSSVFEYPNPCKNSESGIFLALIAQKLALFSPFWAFSQFLTYNNSFWH